MALSILMSRIKQLYWLPQYPRWEQPLHSVSWCQPVPSVDMAGVGRSDPGHHRREGRAYGLSLHDNPEAPRSRYVLSKHHDDVIKWKHFPRYWPFVRRIHRSLVNSPHKGQWRGAFTFSSICALNKRMSKQSWGGWLATPWRSLWRHCNDK